MEKAQEAKYLNEGEEAVVTFNLKRNNFNHSLNVRMKAYGKTK